MSEFRNAGPDTASTAGVEPTLTVAHRVVTRIHDDATALANTAARAMTEAVSAVIAREPDFRVQIADADRIAAAISAEFRRRYGVPATPKYDDQHEPPRDLASWTKQANAFTSGFGPSRRS